MHINCQKNTQVINMAPLVSAILQSQIISHYMCNQGHNQSIVHYSKSTLQHLSSQLTTTQKQLAALIEPPLINLQCNFSCTSQSVCCYISLSNFSCSEGCGQQPPDIWNHAALSRCSQLYNGSTGNSTAYIVLAQQTCTGSVYRYSVEVQCASWDMQCTGIVSKVYSVLVHSSWYVQCTAGTGTVHTGVLYYLVQGTIRYWYMCIPTDFYNTNMYSIVLYACKVYWQSVMVPQGVVRVFG